MLTAWIDGACEPVNPGGTASYGVVVKDDKGKLVVRGYKVIGSGQGMTNNVAEYSALEGLLIWYLCDYKGIPLTIYTDSQLVANQMSGRWGMHNGAYVEIAGRCLEMMEANPVVKVKWIPREQNEEADALSKEALIKAGVRIVQR